MRPFPTSTKSLTLVGNGRFLQTQIRNLDFLGSLLVVSHSLACNEACLFFLFWPEALCDYSR